MHKYDASDYRHTDAALGNPPQAGASPPIDESYYTPPAGETDDPGTWTWTPADRYFVDVFIPAVHQRGMRVILDGVWNHTGREFWAFEDIRKNGKASACADWYKATFDEAESGARRELTAALASEATGSAPRRRIEIRRSLDRP